MSWIFFPSVAPFQFLGLDMLINRHFPLIAAVTQKRHRNAILQLSSRRRAYFFFCTLTFLHSSVPRDSQNQARQGGTHRLGTRLHVSEIDFSNLDAV